jgi:hypothetical protein
MEDIMKHKKVFRLFFVVICISIFVININKQSNLVADLRTDTNIVAEAKAINDNSNELSLNKKIFDYMNKQENRDSVMNAALILSNDKYENDCVFFVAEVLRRLNVDLSKGVSNTYQLMYQLNKRGWKKYSDYKELIPGDICFTTNDNSGYPTHSYIFMKWEKKDSYGYAYVVDNQKNIYGNIYHIRNISKVDVYRGTQKEAFAFFLRK